MKMLIKKKFSSFLSWIKIPGKLAEAGFSLLLFSIYLLYKELRFIHDYIYDYWSVANDLYLLSLKYDWLYTHWYYFWLLEYSLTVLLFFASLFFLRGYHWAKRVLEVMFGVFIMFLLVSIGLQMKAAFFYFILYFNRSDYTEIMLIQIGIILVTSLFFLFGILTFSLIIHHLRKKEYAIYFQ